MIFPDPANINECLARRLKMAKIGDKVESPTLINAISEIVPIRYDGIEESWVVSSPKDATAYQIITGIAVVRDIDGKELLIDLI
jgi:hypothetical protein